MTRAHHLALRDRAEAVALVGERAASPKPCRAASAGRTIEIVVEADRRLQRAADEARAEKMPVRTEPASQRRLTRRRSGGPLAMLRV